MTTGAAPAPAGDRRVRRRSGDAARGGIGAWQSVGRDLVADCRAAFGEAPGRMLAVGVMTDPDNTGTTAEGRSADLRLGCAAD